MNLFDSHSRDKNGNLLSSATAVLLKFDTSHSLHNEIKSLYYNTYALTLHFQVQFIKVHGSSNNKNGSNKYLIKVNNRNTFFTEHLWTTASVMNNEVEKNWSCFYKTTLKGVYCGRKALEWIVFSILLSREEFIVISNAKFA